MIVTGRVMVVQGICEKKVQAKEDSIKVEYRAVSCVFQNIDPPPASPPGECVLPPATKVEVAGRVCLAFRYKLVRHCPDVNCKPKVTLCCEFNWFFDPK